MWHQVLLCYLYLVHNRANNCDSKNQKTKSMASHWGRTDGERHGISKVSGSNISLCVIMVCYFPLHKAQNPAIQQTIHFSQVEPESPFLTYNKIGNVKAKENNLRMIFPLQLWKEATRQRWEFQCVSRETGEANQENRDKLLWENH